MPLKNKRKTSNHSAGSGNKKAVTASKTNSKKVSRKPKPKPARKKLRTTSPKGRVSSAAGSVILKILVERFSGSCIVIDHQQKVLFISEPLAKQFELNPGAYLGKPSMTLIEQMVSFGGENHSLKKVLSEWSGPVPEKKDVRIELNHPAKSVFSCDFGPLEPEKGKNPGKWIRFTDITQQAGMEAVVTEAAKDLEKRKYEFEQRYQEIERSHVELERMKHDILEANRLKSEFLANMSHELRTPLNSILALSSILLARMDGELNEEQEKQIAIIERSGKNLLRLINDILDLSKIEAGRMDLIVSEYDVAEFVENIKMTIMPLIRESSLEFTTEIDPSIEVHNTDENKLKQILLNLLSNAIKFTPSGTVTLRIQPTKFADVLEYSVTDTGIGMEPGHFENIFDPFRQLDGSATRKYGGTGLGLAITKKLVELLGGRLSVESEIGKGSAFRFFIPSRRRGMENSILTQNEIDQMMHEAGGGKTLQDEPDANSLKLDPGKKTILLIDDDNESLYIMKKYITGDEYQTVSVKTGEEGIARAAELMPDIITLDIMMPKKDGWMVLQELKSRADTKHIPVMIISIVDNKKLGFSLGASDYIVKPVVKDMLLKRISKLSAEQGLKRILIVDDDLTQAELVEEILQSDDYLSEVATSGEMAIQLVRRKSYDLIILDLLMPQVDGFVVLDNLRKDPIASDTPVLILTGKLLTKDDQDKLSGKNYHLFLKSMFSREKLLEQIHRILGQT